MTPTLGNLSLAGVDVLLLAGPLGELYRSGRSRIIPEAQPQVKPFPNGAVASPAGAIGGGAEASTDPFLQENLMSNFSALSCLIAILAVGGLPDGLVPEESLAARPRREIGPEIRIGPEIEPGGYESSGTSDTR